VPRLCSSVLLPLLIASSASAVTPAASERVALAGWGRVRG